MLCANIGLNFAKHDIRATSPSFQTSSVKYDRCDATLNVYGHFV